MIQKLSIQLLAIVLYSLCCHLGQAQDIHFSQFFNSPNYQNVGNTGLMSSRDYRMYGQYRTQWGTIPAPFQTMSFGGDFQILRDDAFTNWMGIGFNLLSDKSGDGNLSLMQFGGSIAYHILMNESNLLSFGMGANYNTRGIDFNKLTFDAQWDGMTFNKSLPNGEPRTFERSEYFDVQAGLNYSFFPSEQTYFKIGIGMSHINSPKISLLGDADQKLGMRFIGNIDAILDLDKGWYLSPGIYYTQMQSARQTMFGFQIAKGVSGRSSLTETRVFLGSYLRVKDAAVVLFGLEWDNFKVTASYDATTSGLKVANSGAGAFELSLIYQGHYGGSGYDKANPFKCPRF